MESLTEKVFAGRSRDYAKCVAINEVIAKLEEEKYCLINNVSKASFDAIRRQSGERNE